MQLYCFVLLLSVTLFCFVICKKLNKLARFALSFIFVLYKQIIILVDELLNKAK